MLFKQSTFHGDLSKGSVHMILLFYRGWGGGGARARLIKRATPGEEVVGLIPSVAARSILVGSVSLSV